MISRDAPGRFPEIKDRNAMNRNQIEEILALARLGFGAEEIGELERLSRRMHRWSERLCNDTDVDDKNRAWVRDDRGRQWRGVNPEPGIRRRIAEIERAHPDLVLYWQRDPRGCALYVLRREDVVGIDVSSVYSSRGVAVTGGVR